MKDKLLQIKTPLTNVAKLMKQAGIEIQFTVEHRTDRDFDPEDLIEMISCYPAIQFLDITRLYDNEDYWYKQYTFMQQLTGYDSTVSGVKSEQDMLLVDENNDSELLAQDLYELIKEYRSNITGWDSQAGIVVVIDELYLDTLLPKASVIEDMSARLAKDLIPIIIEYMKTYISVNERLKTILRANPNFERLRRMLMNRDKDSKQYKIGNYFNKSIVVDGYNSVHGQAFYTDDSVVVDALMSLYFMQCINVLMRGNDAKFIDDFDLNVTRIFEVACTESPLCKSINLSSLINSITGHKYKGTIFDKLLRMILSMTEVKNNVKFPAVKDNMLFIDSETDSNARADKSRKILQNMNGILKYAETAEILECFVYNESESLTIFAEGFSNAKNDAKDFKRAIEMSRRASLAEVELEFINTKYSKKDAINQAYTVVQEATTLMGKLHSQKAIDIVVQVISNLNYKILEARKTDHKKMRSTINIAYPSGYEG